MNHQDDREIINSVLGGNGAAYAVLVQRYDRLVFTLTMRMLKNREDAEEAAQDVFVKAYRALNTFKGDSKLSTWLYRIAYNRCLDMLARKKRAPAVRNIDELVEMNQNSYTTVLDTMERDQQQQLLKKCIEQLPEEEAFLITVYYYDEQSIAELAEITGLSESNVKVRLYRARKKMFILLEASAAFNKTELL